MDVYLASDGSLIRLEASLAEFDSVEHLHDDVSAHSGIVTQNVLMFLEDGRELRADILEEAWQRGGEGTGSTGTRTVVYLFDRETFWAEAEDSAARYAEEVQLPPQLPLSAIHDSNLIQQPFILASDHVQHLQSLFLAQSQALSIAYSNLFYHLSPFLQEFGTFAPKAERELDLEDELIRGARADMAMLSKVVIHEELRRKDGKDRDKRTIADYVNGSKMEQVRDGCRSAHEGNVSRYNELVSAVEELSAQSEAERRNAEERSTAVGEEFQHGLSRFELAMRQVDALAAGGVDHAVQDLVELDRGMREDLIALTNIKNEYTLDVHIHLCQIAHLQIQVVNLAPTVHQLESDLNNPTSSKAAFPHLYRLRNLPFAYAATVVEVVRRREFGQYLADWTERLRTVMGKFVSTESARRAKIMEDVISHMPFVVPVFEEQGKIGVDINVSTGLDVLKSVTLDRSNVQDLLRWVESLKDDPEVLRETEAGRSGPVEFLEQHLGELIAGMDGVTDELDSMVEKSVLLGSNLKTSQTISAHLRAAEDAKRSHEDHVSNLVHKHQAELGELQDRHEERTRMLQTRQGELQEELVRLRTDLDEESITRQALATQLEDTQREHEEKQQLHEDQTDLITGLQAELEQEKDRATDLGVRLQEALLDVDGLRNAEQSLQEQVRNLQDERSRSIQQLVDAQTASSSLESHAAGLQAELEATKVQLAQARAERDQALRDQSAEAERMMRDHIAEADGDRAVLEHQNLTLQKELELAKVDAQKKISEVENREVRTANNLKAELSFTKAHLRTAQQKETVLADELAMSKDNVQQATKRLERQEEVAREAVTLVGNYWETCSRLLGVINSSATISGSATGMGSVHGLQSLSRGGGDGDKKLRTTTSANSTQVDKADMKDSGVLATSLSTAQGFDLASFSEAVMKTITLVKKWGKSCKTYRDLSRNRLSFRDFGRGDLALFLPTRNAAVRAWACFHMSAPHNFLKADAEMLQQMSQQDWLVARIVKTEEAVASGGETNPFGLADGLRYWVHTVEGYNPNAIRPPRRTASTSYYGRSAEDAAGTSNAAEQSIQRTSPETNTAATSPQASRGRTAHSALDVAVQDRESPSVGRQMSPPAENDDSSQSAPTPALSQSPPPERILESAPKSSVPAIGPSKLSPVGEASSSSDSQPSLQQIVPSSTPITSKATALSTYPDAMVSRPGSRTHHRPPSRISSPPSRDHPPPLFTPSTFGRPASVASTASYTGHAPFASGKAAPSMAVTTSGQGGGAARDGQEAALGDLNPFMETTQARRKSSTNSLLPEGLFKPPMDHRPSSAGTSSPGSSGFQSVAGAAGTPGGAGQNTPSPGTSPGMGASRLIRGFSLRKRTPSGIADAQGQGGSGTITGGAGGTVKPSAMEMLRRFEGGGS